MQKLLRRTLLARNQSLRRQRRDSKREWNHDKHDALREASKKGTELHDAIRAERTQRREDHALGPLAPRRDVGESKNRVGTRSVEFAMPHKIEKAKRVEYLNYATGDRVCLVRGREKGKIGRVTEVNEDAQTVTIQGVNRTDVRLYGFQMLQDPDRAPFQTIEMPISIHDVRLVWPMRDRITQQLKDVVITNMYGGSPTSERHHRSNLPKHTRYVDIAGEAMEIPWPQERINQSTTFPSDTPRYFVEPQAATYVPSVIVPPFEPSIINECRAPYGRLRNDHEEAFMKKKIMQDMERDYRYRQRLLTPQSEYYERMAEEKASARAAAITEETRDLIEETQRLAREMSLVESEERAA